MIISDLSDKGTWTPTKISGNGSIDSIEYAVYKRVGDIVSVAFRFTATMDSGQYMIFTMPTDVESSTMPTNGMVNRYDDFDVYVEFNYLVIYSKTTLQSSNIFGELFYALNIM